MMQLSREELREAYRRMTTIREFEDTLHEEFSAGNIPGFVHLYAGEEASGVGVCMHLDDRDVIASTHRGHGHCIAKGVDPAGMMLEIYGKKDGLCGGKGGSMHIADLSSRVLTTMTDALARVAIASGSAPNRYGSPPSAPGIAEAPITTRSAFSASRRMAFLTLGASRSAPSPRPRRC
jgi:TPP-dependent pyruvate/acetoin dehydrogenase alpha subunit